MITEKLIVITVKLILITEKLILITEKLILITVMTMKKFVILELEILQQLCLGLKRNQSLFKKINK